MLFPVGMPWKTRVASSKGSRCTEDLHIYERKADILKESERGWQETRNTGLELSATVSVALLSPSHVLLTHPTLSCAAHSYIVRDLLDFPFYSMHSQVVLLSFADLVPVNKINCFPCILCP